LHVAASRGHVEVARFLVGHGVRPTAQDNDGRTPLHEALSHGHMEVARFLFEHSTITGTTTAPARQGSRFVYYLVVLVVLVEIYLRFM
jgi:ankyrin repeat protein